MTIDRNSEDDECASCSSGQVRHGLAVPHLPPSLAFEQEICYFLTKETVKTHTEKRNPRIDMSKN